MEQFGRVVIGDEVGDVSQNVLVRVSEPRI
jgi:hypothetical protein